MDTQLALLPVWCASCDSFVMLFTPNLLSRLWCVVELFVWMHVGDTQAIVVCGSDFLHARASHDVEQAAHAIGIDQQLQQADAQPHIAQTASALASFDVRKAECFGDDTRARLLSVIEVGCGSLDTFSEIAISVLSARLDAQGILAKLRAENQQAHKPRRLLSGAAKRSRSQRRSAAVVPFADLTAGTSLSSLPVEGDIVVYSADGRRTSELRLSDASHANGSNQADVVARTARTTLSTAGPSSGPSSSPRRNANAALRRPRSP